MKKTFYLMRHGQTLFNVRRKMQGSCDAPLTELGIKQCEEGAKYFENIELDHIYSSTSERASDTLEIVTGNKMPYTRVKDLKEMNFGVFEGESEDLSPPIEEFESFFLKYGGESAKMVQERVVKACIEIMEKEDHNNVLAVSHGLCCLYFIREWMDTLDVAEAAKGGLPNCTIFKYEYEDKKFALVDIIRPEVK